MPDSVDTDTIDHSTGFQDAMEALRNADSRNILQQLQHLFKSIAQMDDDELVASAQTVRVMAAMDPWLATNPLALAVMNAIRTQMLKEIYAKGHPINVHRVALERRFEQALSRSRLDTPIDFL